MEALQVPRRHKYTRGGARSQVSSHPVLMCATAREPTRSLHRRCGFFRVNQLILSAASHPSELGLAKSPRNLCASKGRNRRPFEHTAGFRLDGLTALSKFQLRARQGQVIPARLPAYLALSLTGSV